MKLKLLRSLMGFGFAALAMNASAQILVTVNTTDISAVTFTATSANAAADSSTDAVSGFSMLNFFNDTQAIDWGSGNSTTLSVGSVMVNEIQSDGPPPYGNGPGLNFSTVGGSDTYTFSTTSQALTGSTTLNMTGLLSFLPANGTTGEIKAGRQMNGTLGATIGQWQVVNTTSSVPEPASSTLLAGLALSGFVATRRRKRSV